MRGFRQFRVLLIILISIRKRSDIWIGYFEFDFVAVQSFGGIKFSQFSRAGLFKVFLVLLSIYSFGFYFVFDFICWIDNGAGKSLAVRL